MTPQTDSAAVARAVATINNNRPLRVKLELEQQFTNHPEFINLSTEELKEQVLAIPGMVSRTRRQPLFELKSRAVMVALLCSHRSLPVEI